MRENSKRNILRHVAGLMLAAAATSTLLADVTLPNVFTPHAVLQRDQPIPVWGWASPGEEVAVRLAGQTVRATADHDGKWTVTLSAIPVGGPHRLIVQGNNTLEIDDILIGEVWLCSGQSNMAMTVSRADNPEEETAAATFPQIRMVTIARKTAPTPQAKCEGQWVVCGPETVGGFSATAYFFGRELHRELGVPVGLINSSWGGTPVEAWTSAHAQAAIPAIRPVLEKWEKMIADYDPGAAAAGYDVRLNRWKEAAAKAKADGKPTPRRPAAPVDPAVSQHRPANNYNGMIAPLVPYAIRGAIWYQGESNAGREFSHLYGVQLGVQIADWRKAFGQGDFQFLTVQLPNFHAPQQEPVEPTGWVTVREGMLETLAIANTGIAITVDIGEEKDIHPKNKQEVGRRLAQWALGTTYERDVVACGPLYRSMTAKDGRITLRFDYAAGGLTTSDDGPLRGFAIAGADQRFVWAEAVIDGETVVVSSSEVAQPVAVRYAWADNPNCNLSNQAGLPAAPLRTDKW